MEISGSRIMWWRLKQVAMLAMCGVLAGCGGSSSSSGVSIKPVCIPGTGATVTISGAVTFDRVYHAVDGGLDYGNIVQKPIRGAVVEAVCNSTIATTTTDAAGLYSLNVPAGTSNMLIRVKAQMLQTGTPAWNFRVINNTSNGVLYALDSSRFISDTSMMLNLNAASGWGVSSYTPTRAAAPFAILDSVYDAFQKVLQADPVAVFPALNINWSVNNVPSGGNVAIGQITTSHFNGTQIYILGAANIDTDEYDDHVIIHEWGHYFEHNFSRADNIGGSHSSGDVLDIRVAFGEGFGNAYSAIASDDPIYADANGSLQAGGFTINMETNCPGGNTNRGWYSECSVQSVLYDLYDSATGDADALTMGFTPLYNVLVNEQKNTPAMTSIFSFVDALKQNNSGSVTDIDALLVAQSIDSVADAYGSTQTTNNSGSADALLVFETATVGGAAVNVCSSSEFQVYNGYEVSRFIKFNLPGTSVTITAVKTASTGTGNDPDLVLYRNGTQVAIAEATVANTETLSVSNLTAGNYVLELYDYGNRTTGVGSTCYNVTL
jgi:hypothetical protein